MGRPAPTVAAWLLAELDPTLRLAAALTGSSTAAADLVADTLADTLADDRVRAQLAPDHDPTGPLRPALLRRFLDHPPEHVHDPLDTLAALPRAVVVLRDGEHLTSAEIATLVDRPAKRVVRMLTEHGGRYDREIEFRSGLAPTPSELVDRYPEALARRRASRRRRRSRIGLATAWVAAAAALATLLPPMVLQLLPPEVRRPGEWRFTHQIALSANWEIEAQRITPTTEQTELRLPVEPGVIGSCSVILGPEPTTGITRPVRISSRWSGHYVERVHDATVLQWSYAPGAYASVSCGTDASDELLLDVAAAVRFRGAPIRVPFTLDRLPSGTRVGSVTVVPRAAETTEAVLVSLEPPDPRSGPMVTVHYGDRRGTYRCVGPNGTLERRFAWQSDGPGEGSDQLCLSVAWPGSRVSSWGTYRVNRGASRAAMRAVAEELRPAPSLGDRSTWFDAADLSG